MSIVCQEVMVELYSKDIWKDSKTVNVITTALFSKVTKVGICVFNGSNYNGITVQDLKLEEIQI